MSLERLTPKSGPAPDPKDRLLEYRLYERALLALQSGRLDDAIPTFIKQ